MHRMRSRSIEENRSIHNREQFEIDRGKKMETRRPTGANEVINMWERLWVVVARNDALAIRPLIKCDRGKTTDVK